MSIPSELIIRPDSLDRKTWLNTPDNRKGWASYFLEEGYEVYLIDDITVGRSTQTDLKGYPLTPATTGENAEVGFSTPKIGNYYSQGKLPTQWPGMRIYQESAIPRS